MGKISLRMFALGILLCLALWWSMAQLLQMPVIPSPVQVLLRLAAKFPDTIAIHAGYSLLPLLWGILSVL